MPIRHSVALILEHVKPASHGERRYQRILLAIFTALVSKGLGLIITFVSIPLALSYLGAERFGIWMTISTLLTWFQILDIGLGNGLTNVLAEAYGNGRSDLAQNYVATAFWLLMALALMIGVGVTVIWPWLDWEAIFRINSALARGEIDSAMAWAILIFLFGLPLSLIPKILGAYQEGATANYWVASGNVGGLLALFLVTRTQGGLSWLVIAVAGVPLVIAMASAVWLFVKSKPWLLPTPFAVRRHCLGKITNVGIMFFLIQIAALIIFQTDNLVIVRYLGVEQVTPYSVTYRLFLYASVVQMVVFPYLWPAYVEAFTVNDTIWIKRTFWLSVGGVFVITVFLTIPLILFGNHIIAYWAGAEAVPPQPVFYWMGFWIIIMAPSNLVACLLNAAGKLQIQVIWGIINGIVNLILSIILVQHYGIVGIIAGTVLAYLCFILIPQIYLTRQVFIGLNAAIYARFSV